MQLYYDYGISKKSRTHIFVPTQYKAMPTRYSQFPTSLHTIFIEQVTISDNNVGRQWPKIQGDGAGWNVRVLATLTPWEAVPLVGC